MATGTRISENHLDDLVDRFNNRWKKEDVEAAMSLLLLHGEVSTGLTDEKLAAENGAVTSQANNRARIHGPHDLDLLPDQVRNLIKSLNGTEIAFVTQKILSGSDLDKNQNRFSFNVNKVQNEFLTQEEVDKISVKKEKEIDNVGRAPRGLEVTVIEPCLKITRNVEFRKRSKNDGRYSEYVLIGKWLQIAENKKNGLKKKKKTVKAMELPNGARFVFCISESLKTDSASCDPVRR